MKQLRSILLSVVMLPLAGIVAIPFYYILVNTLKTQPEISASPLGLPSGLDFSNYTEVFKALPIWQSFLNTLYVGVVSIALMLLIGSMAAYGMLIGQGRLTKFIGVICLIAFLVPGQTTLIPLYRMLSGMYLVDTLEGLIVLYLAGSIFCYFLIIGYMRTIPMELFESARIDGASAFRIYRSIVLPLIRPILVTVGVFQAMWVWNDFITPNVFINSPDKQTLVLQVYSAVGQFSTDWPAFMTLSVIVLAPLVVFFIVAQRHIVSGLVTGSVKG
ncbi:carbohydrate ABC transporter permease [Glycomyces luteolus]|uniref:Carbohydrate ABC transporter permease n=1 Tax=Glycomyces luteolus TaxID=2670330 RepID=A0A9X3P7I8_9ACTN|nr:carbohydrate ABC transporter permease [Glycomyces luteolus]MDA1358230.1 carbohydrate ABC transporter permease [Glycomyces luteolus]